MQGYSPSSYGDAFADVYDEWYDRAVDVATAVAAIVALAGDGGRVLELGVGTGRLAIPLAQRGLRVVGLDSSEAMLGRLRAKDGGGVVTAMLGDMVDDMPDGPFELVVVPWNTFFMVLEEERQRECFVQASSRLVPGGAFVIEAFVPAPQAASEVSVHSLTVDRVVLRTSVADPTTQRAFGQHIEITESGGIRLRPWSIRYATPEQLDEMAAAAGLTLRARWSGFDRGPFTDESERHVSVYERVPSA